MRPEPERELVDATRAWLLRADEDLAAADAVLRGPRSMPNACTFHAQQAAEKSLKAFLTWHATTFAKTHSIAELGRACAAIDSSLEELLRRASTLTEYAWRSRYPGDWTPPSKAEALAALSLAQVVFRAVSDRLPSDTHA